MSTISSDDLRAILAGCEGVTTGPWANGLHYRQKTGDRDFAPIFANSAAPIAMVPLSVGGYQDPEGPLNAAHIARLDPDTVRSIITELLARRSPPAQEGMVTVKPLDDDQIMEAIRAAAPWKHEAKLYDLLTYEKSPPLIPQATYDVPSYRAINLVRAIEARIRSALAPAPDAVKPANDGSAK